MDERIVEVADAHKRFGAVAAVDGVSLSVRRGEIFALLGPNGAGKTTAIGIVCSLVNKTGGEVRVFGHSIDSDLAAAKACIGLVPQEVNLNLFDTVQNIVLNQAGYYGIPRDTVSPLEGIRALVGDRANVVHSQGVVITENDDWWADEVKLGDPAENRRRLHIAQKLCS